MIGEQAPEAQFSFSLHAPASVQTPASQRSRRFCAGPLQLSAPGASQAQPGPGDSQTEAHIRCDSRQTSETAHAGRV
jgi:hypothetical protein